MRRLFHLTEIVQPEDVIPFLKKGIGDWQPGKSACELARSWVAADGIPPSVRAVLDTCPDYQRAELIEGFFEREIELAGRGAASQTDLMAFVKAAGGYAVVAVEGKAEEVFGPTVVEWDNGSPNKQVRLRSLCDTLGLDAAAVGSIRYQLLHRTASAIYEAQRYRCDRALMLVHSFSPTRTSFSDFVAFAQLLQCPVDIGAISPPRRCAGVELRLGWVADTASTGMRSWSERADRAPKADEVLGRKRTQGG
ncbi:hypothetical protein J5Y09_18290 [Roseomonas sp. PWR1]|uniref:DUF6946 domain-containing protein n=1 Tax=Roseomonas nitratireducens TaxID=2820810 RepID=A0ABS4AZA5_9PROT|nr:hypothetical protein [Neoroseomonas nitratireducens]MBP0465882.1 hypothetical protein [Neoroseomonas nitratireducens]